MPTLHFKLQSYISQDSLEEQNGMNMYYKKDLLDWLDRGPIAQEWVFVRGRASELSIDTVPIWVWRPGGFGESLLFPHVGRLRKLYSEGDSSNNNRIGTITSKQATMMVLRRPYLDNVQKRDTRTRESLLPSGSSSQKCPHRPAEWHASVDCRSHQNDHQY